MRVQLTQGLGKFRIKSDFNIVLGVFLTGLFIISSLNSCKQKPTSAEKVYLDTLFYKLKGNEKALNIDEQSLVDRKEIIRKVWLPSLKDTLPDIRMRMEDELRGMLTAYDYYLDRQLLLKSSTRILLEEWQSFKEKTDQNEIDRETFKAKYKELNQRIESNSEEIAVIAQPIYELEPMWLRFKRMMEFRGIHSSLATEESSQ